MKLFLKPLYLINFKVIFSVFVIFLAAGLFLLSSDAKAGNMSPSWGSYQCTDTTGGKDKTCREWFSQDNGGRQIYGYSWSGTNYQTHDVGVSGNNQLYMAMCLSRWYGVFADGYCTIGGTGIGCSGQEGGSGPGPGGKFCGRWNQQPVLPWTDLCQSPYGCGSNVTVKAPITDSTDYNYVAVELIVNDATIFANVTSFERWMEFIYFNVNGGTDVPNIQVGQSFNTDWNVSEAVSVTLSWGGPIGSGSASVPGIGSRTFTCSSVGWAEVRLDYTGPGGSGPVSGSQVRSINCIPSEEPPPPPPPPPGSFNLSVSRSGNGSGTVAGPGISCGSDCSETYNQIISVTLSATADSGSTFASWSGCGSVNGNNCTVTMNQNRSITATFNASGGGGCQGDCAQYISQDVPAAAGTGQLFSVSITMKNVGTTTWTAADQYRLGSQNPENNSTWGLVRVNVPSTVSPGQQVTFNFNPTAPSSPGNYNFQWRMLRENVQWFGDFTPNTVINVTSGPPPPPPGNCTDNSSITFTDSIPDTLNPGQKESFIVRVTDSGDTRWYHGNAYQFLQQSNLSISPSYGRLSHGVYPGDQVDWTFILTAPSSPGTYTLNMRMNHSAGAEYIKPDGTTCPAPSSDTYFGQTATRTFNVSQPSPTISDVVVTLPNYCISGPAATVGWSYSDSSGRPQSAYQVQIDEQPSFSSPEIDSGKVICQNCRSYFSGTGILQFNTTYGVRARTWNNFDVQSAWQEATSCIGEGCQSNGKWKTPSHAYPNTNSPYQFTWSPANPAANQQVQFTDRTLFDSSSNNKAWSWTFVPAGGGPGSSTAQNPVYTFNSEGVYQVTEKARDNALPPGQYCTGPTQAVNSQKPIPIWKEIAPR